MHFLHVILSLVALLPLVAVGRSTSKSSFGDDVTVNQYNKYIAASTTLQHGDSCSWDDEVARQDEFTKESQVDKTDPLFAELFYAFVKDSLANKRIFCSATKSLVCDHVTETCACGEFYMQVALGDRYKSSAYVLEQGDDGQSVCRYARSSMCLPTKPSKDTGCATGLECLSVETETQCTNATRAAYARQLQLKGKTYAQYQTDLLTGKICACLDSVDGNDDHRKPVYREKPRSGNYPKYGSNDRSKRSLGIGNSYYEQARSAWSPLTDI